MFRNCYQIIIILTKGNTSGQLKLNKEKKNYQNTHIVVDTEGIHFLCYFFYVEAKNKYQNILILYFLMTTLEALLVISLYFILAATPLEASRDTLGIGGWRKSTLQFKFQFKFFCIFLGAQTFFLGTISLRRWWRYPPPKQFKTFPGHIISFTAKENHISSAVIKILRYRQKKVYYFI